MTVLPSSRPLAFFCFAVGYCFFTVACATAVYRGLWTADQPGAVVVAACWTTLSAAALALFLNLRSRLLGLGLPVAALAEAVVCNWSLFVLSLVAFIPVLILGAPLPARTAVRFLAALLELAFLAAILDTRLPGPKALGGALGDRIAGLAQTGSLRARKVYLADQTVPGWSGVLTRKVVILTPALLNRLSRREVDALAARQMNHPASGRLFLILLVFTFLAATYGAQDFVALLAILSLQAILVAGFLVRADRVASHRATNLTGDPVALITALAKIDRGRGRASRLHRIAAAAGIDRPHLAELLANPSGADDRYTVDVREGRSTPPLLY